MPGHPLWGAPITTRITKRPFLLSFCCFILLCVYYSFTTWSDLPQDGKTYKNDDACHVNVTAWQASHMTFYHFPTLAFIWQAERVAWLAHWLCVWMTSRQLCNSTIWQAIERVRKPIRSDKSTKLWEKDIKMRIIVIFALLCILWDFHEFDCWHNLNVTLALIESLFIV